MLEAKLAFKISEGAEKSHESIDEQNAEQYVESKILEASNRGDYHLDVELPPWNLQTVQSIRKKLVSLRYSLAYVDKKLRISWRHYLLN